MSSTINLANWLALNHCSGIGPSTFKKYLQYDPLLQSLPKNLQPNWDAVERDLDWLATQPQAHIITLMDAAYPSLLKNIHDPPPLLYVLGDVSRLNQPQLAMVGSRKCSFHGKQQAHKLAQQLASAGLVINSGLAFGIDAASHIGALDTVAGQTVAVLAHGIDQVHPKQHTALAQQILQRGCLVSEFAIGVIPLPSSFPRRNRLISGMSLGVLVVEANLKSGSLITAGYARDQGREVFAVPGSINLPNTRGCHYLIKQGAKLVESAEDVLEELVALLNLNIRAKYADTVKVGSKQQALTAGQQQLLEFIDYDSTCMDEILDRSGLTSSAVSASLFEMELKGFITAVPGGYARTLD